MSDFTFAIKTAIVLFPIVALFFTIFYVIYQYHKYGSINGFTAVLQINLKNADISSFKEKYYYKYEEEAKVVNFEMKAYGFTCN